MLASAVRSTARSAARRVAFTAPKTTSIRCMSSINITEGENVIVPLVTDSLEWTLSSPPPLHQFEEPPLIVEVDHLDLKPGAEVEDILEAQGEAITDIVGKEAWVDNDSAAYEGLIPQNQEWTEFVDEKTGEWVYLDELGNRVEKSVSE
uniref:Uncharacterized protein n=1 Tax=Eucampia antarctica TaxID=49252 RepID=A0A7S2WGT9_9STRA|mmetsp:Transcript_30157/g.29035  ORF Transcript_30157/g.29035 Transcript_30157/m.29035 type:complete len:149 (+) Transcript_30157:1-447(+)